MNTTKPKTKRTVRRKTDASPLDESINQYIDSILANGQGSSPVTGRILKVSKPKTPKAAHF